MYGAVIKDTIKVEYSPLQNKEENERQMHNKFTFKTQAVDFN